MNWWRAHHGMIDDVKMAVIGKDAGVSVAEALAFWFGVLCRASSEIDRGSVLDFDPDTVSVRLGIQMEDGQRIWEVLQRRGWVSEGRITQWGKYAPERLAGRPWEALRASVFERDNYTCTYCGTTDDQLECDHVIPWSKGGDDRMSNLTTACASCNRRKHARTPEGWKR